MYYSCINMEGLVFGISSDITGFFNVERSGSLWWCVLRMLKQQSAVRMAVRLISMTMSMHVSHSTPSSTESWSLSDPLCGFRPEVKLVLVTRLYDDTAVVGFQLQSCLSCQLKRVQELQLRHTMIQKITTLCTERTFFVVRNGRITPALLKKLIMTQWNFHYCYYCLYYYDHNYDHADHNYYDDYYYYYCRCRFKCIFIHINNTTVLTVIRPKAAHWIRKRPELNAYRAEDWEERVYSTHYWRRHRTKPLQPPI